MIQVQVRMPKKLVDYIDGWISEGRFSSRSEAIRMVIARYQEIEKTRAFYSMLMERSREAREHPEEMTRLAYPDNL